MGGMSNAAEMTEMAKRSHRPIGSASAKLRRASKAHHAVVDAPVQRVRKLQRLFRATHQQGTQALLSGNYNAFANAIAVERRLIKEQRAAIEAQRAVIGRHQHAFNSRVLQRRRPARKV